MHEADQFIAEFQKFFASAITKRSYNNRLQEALLYATMNGGKRTRPNLCYFFAYSFNPTIDIQQVLYTAGALEALHCYSLVHDDLPAMDNDDLRRGLATVHKKYSEATAILVGDALQTLSFQLLSCSSFDCDDAIKVKLIQILSYASGAQGMVNGQFLDMHLDPAFDKKNIDDIALMHQQKTGNLISASCQMGYMLTGYNNLALHEDIKKIGNLIGRIFQIQDDILDVTQTTQVLGKTAGKDIALEKSTIISLLGLEQAQKLLQTLVTELYEIINALPVNVDVLKCYLSLIMLRQH